MSLPFTIAVGDILLHDGRRLRFEGDLGDLDLHITDVRTGARFRVPDPATGELRTPTVRWLREELKAGRLFHSRAGEPLPGDRRGDVTNCDEDAADTIDPRSSWRRTWVREARAAGIKSEPMCAHFIRDRAAEIAAGYSERKGRVYDAPGASTLRKWIAKAPEQYAPGAHVAQAGRKKGASQLTQAEDALVHEAALYFWSDIADEHSAYNGNHAMDVTVYQWGRIIGRRRVEINVRGGVVPPRNKPMKRIFRRR